MSGIKLAEVVEAVTSIFYGVIGALLVLIIWSLFSPALQARPIVTVNLSGIIKSYAQKIAKENLPKQEATKKVTSFILQLESSIKYEAQQRQVIVLPHAAVITGAKDITPYIVRGFGK